MKKMMFMAFAAIMLSGMFAACSNDAEDDFTNRENEAELVDGYDYSEHGFFINGEIKVKDFFEKDSILTGWTKYTQRDANYRTKDGVDHVLTLGYGLVVKIGDFAAHLAFSVSDQLLTRNSPYHRGWLSSIYLAHSVEEEREV